MKKLLDKSFVLVQFDEENNVVEIIWRKFALSKQYRETIQTAYNAVVTYQASGWLSDLTNSGVVAMDDQKWMKEEIIPKSIGAGVKKVAFVRPKNVFSRVFLRNIDTELTTTKEHFANIEEAREWIKIDAKLTTFTKEHFVNIHYKQVKF